MPNLPFAVRIRTWSIHTAAAVATLIIGGMGTLHAQLTWKQTTAEITPDPNATVVEAVFPFTNAGKTPVDIDQIQTSCGCTTAKLEQRHYEPGQGGEIVARFTVGDRLGLQHKDIVVSYGDQKETELNMEVHLPELLHLEPPLVSWKPGEASKTKTIKLTVTPDTLKLDDLTVKASNTRVTAVLRPTVEGKEYELQLTPDTTDKATVVTLLIRSRLGTRENLFRTYATIQLSPPPPAGDVPAPTLAPPP